MDTHQDPATLPPGVQVVGGDDDLDDDLGEPTTHITSTVGAPHRPNPIGQTPLDDGDPDDDGAPVGEAPLDVVRAELAAEVAEDDTLLEVPTRPGYMVSFRRDFSGDEIKAWRGRSKSRRGRRAARGGEGDDLDELKFSALILVNTCTGLIRRGEPVLDDAGDPMTFRSHEFLAMFPNASGQTTQACRLFYGRDAWMAAAAEGVLAEAGWGSTLEDAGLDPTPGL